MGTDGQIPNPTEPAQKPKPHGHQPGTDHDAELRSKVWLVLWQAEELAELDLSQVEVTIHQCDVWLSGKVGNDRERHLAECLAGSLDGVHRCHNELRCEKKPAR